MAAAFPLAGAVEGDPPRRNDPRHYQGEAFPRGTAVEVALVDHDRAGQPGVAVDALAEDQAARLRLLHGDEDVLARLIALVLTAGVLPRLPGAHRDLARDHGLPRALRAGNDLVLHHFGAVADSHDNLDTVRAKVVLLRVDVTELLRRAQRADVLLKHL